MADGYRERPCPDCGALTVHAPQLGRWMNADSAGPHFCVPVGDVAPGHGAECVCERCWQRLEGERQEVAQPVRGDQALVARLDSMERSNERLVAMLQALARDVQTLKTRLRPNGSPLQPGDDAGPIWKARQSQDDDGAA